MYAVYFYLLCHGEVLWICLMWDIHANLWEATSTFAWQQRIVIGSLNFSCSKYIEPRTLTGDLGGETVASVFLVQKWVFRKTQPLKLGKGQVLFTAFLSSSVYCSYLLQGNCQVAKLHSFVPFTFYVYLILTSGRLKVGRKYTINSWSSRLTDQNMHLLLFKYTDRTIPIQL